MRIQFVRLHEKCSETRYEIHCDITLMVLFFTDPIVRIVRRHVHSRGLVGLRRTRIVPDVRRPTRVRLVVGRTKVRGHNAADGKWDRGGGKCVALSAVLGRARRTCNVRRPLQVHAPRPDIQRPGRVRVVLRTTQDRLLLRLHVRAYGRYGGRGLHCLRRDDVPARHRPTGVFFNRLRRNQIEIR